MDQQLLSVRLADTFNSGHIPSTTCELGTARLLLEQHPPLRMSANASARNAPPRRLSAADPPLPGRGGAGGGGARRTAGDRARSPWPSRRPGRRKSAERGIGWRRRATCECACRRSRRGRTCPQSYRASSQHNRAQVCSSQGLGQSSCRRASCGRGWVAIGLGCRGGYGGSGPVPGRKVWCQRAPVSSERPAAAELRMRGGFRVRRVRRGSPLDSSGCRGG
jgi:hypothetical protein